MLPAGRTSFLRLVLLWLLVTVCSSKVNELQCYNDYATRIDCHWTEDISVKPHIPMRLFYQKVDSLSSEPEQQCDAVQVNQSDSLISWNCTIWRKSFYASLVYKFTFKPVTPLNVRQTTSLMDNIRPRPPANLSISHMMTGDYHLTWQTVYSEASGSRLHGHLQYQVDHCSHQQCWQDAVSELVLENRTHLVISRRLAKPGEHRARVRARPQASGQYTGYWSQWSTEIRWNVTPETTGPKTEPADVLPKNLQCEYDGVAEMGCTWEVPSQSLGQVEFKLHYAKANNMLSECSPTVTQQQTSHPTSFGCKFPVDGQETADNYTVVLKAVEPTHMIRLCKTIRAAEPFNLTVTPSSDGYKLKWEAIEKPEQALQYQIRQEKADQAGLNPKMVDIPQSSRFYVFPKSSLELGSRYSFRVRAKVAKAGQDGYDGPWSEWSREIILNVKGDSEYITILITGTLISLAILMTPPICWLICRRKRSWLDSIPNPGKSKLFQSEGQGALLRPTTSLITITDEMSLDESCVTCPEIIPSEKHKLASSEETQMNVTPSPEPSEQLIGQDQPYQQFALLTSGNQWCQPVPAEALPSLVLPHTDLRELTGYRDPPCRSDYDGPYLYSGQASSLPNFFSKPKAEPGKGADGQSEDAQDRLWYTKIPQEVSETLLESGNNQATPPVSDYVLSFAQTASSPLLVPKTSGSYVQAERTCSRKTFPDEPPFVVNNYVLSPPKPNLVPLPGTMAGYVHNMNSNIFCPSSSQSVPEAFPTRSANSQRQSLAALCPPDSRGYVLSLPGDTAPQELGNKQSANQRQSVNSQTSSHQALSDYVTELKPSSKFQAHPEEPPVKKPLYVEDTPSEFPVVLLQQGSKPIVLKQVGDYCFIPTSLSHDDAGSNPGALLKTQDMSHDHAANQQVSHKPEPHQSLCTTTHQLVSQP
uniref:Cytokine receptor common subunit beta n=1 Tax=Callorhinchus milii TaxID=7868 RepID=V9K9I3_CALMI